jgi:hypothetical protein
LHALKSHIQSLWMFRSWTTFRTYINSPTKLFVPQKVRLEHIQQIFAKQSLKKLLDDKMLDGLQKNMNEMQQRARNIFALEVTLLGVLLLCIAPINVNVTLFGVQSSDIRQLRELLLAIYSSLTFIRFEARAGATFIAEALIAAVEATAGRDTELKYILRLRFGVGVFPPTMAFRPSSELFPGLGYTLTRLVLFLASNLVGLVRGLVIVGILIWTMVDVYHQPSFNIAISLIVIAYSIVVLIAEQLWLNLASREFVYRRRENLSDTTWG